MPLDGKRLGRWMAAALSALLPIALMAGTAAGRDNSAAGRATFKVENAVWRDSKRIRELPVRIYHPEAGNDGQTPGSRPVILFSHGLGGSREGGRVWAEHWATHGFIVLAIQHPGSDETVWKGKAARDAVASLKAARSASNLALRVGDVPFVIDEITRRANAGEVPWKWADMKRIGMSGHSFGAGTTLAVSGQKMPGLAGQSGLDTRITAALGLSPIARLKFQLPRQFGDIRIPFLSITGTEDGAVLGDDAVWQDRTLPYEHMPSGGKYLLVVDGADHMVLGGHAMGRRKDVHHDSVVQAKVKAVTLAFWQAHLNDDVAARKWLQDESPAGVGSLLGGTDQYRWK